MDRLRDLHVQVAVEAELCGGEGLERRIFLQSAAEDVSAIGDHDCIALWQRRKVEGVRKCRVLEEESMVCSDEDVRGVRVCQALDQIDQLSKRVLGCLEDLA